ncbi:Npr2 urea transporter [Candida orthopsilosis Co 90-125]|uniref:Npr2 urea transporter n=1 Tax=Candida orthopsilosis (strain 90-125) TaxID=1136231 RepID=H8X1B9_CANO9|nr:Npr2 urea transporter [Candida orthopsilosis Co 90-125]CCG22159.1 Npr2 urea transporter [Candida orthopsilosis Co 90-125]
MSDGFIPIVSIFYSVFHPTEGTKIIHQFPENLISTSSTINDDNDETTTGLFNFDTVKNYVIPKPQLCNQLLSFKINSFKVIGYPVNMVNDHYARNSFNFNFCFVFNYELGDVSPYEPAIKRMGQMFQVLEEQNFILSKLDKDNSFYKDRSGTSDMDTTSKIDEYDLELYANKSQRSVAENDASVNAPGHSKTKRITLSSIESLIQQIYQDLNNYSECCIPLDSSNSVDIKLFPLLPAPVNLKAYQVPIATVKLKSLVDVNWDPTMVKILPYIDGINSVKRISELADANYLVTKQCIQHLMHYKCIELIDIFQFSNIYAPTNRIGDFLKSDGRMAEQCQAYVVTNGSTDSLRSSSFTNTPAQNSPKPMAESSSPSTFNFSKRMPSGSTSPYMRQQNFLSRSPKSFTMQYANVKVPTKTSLFYLYRSLNQGQSIKEWYVQHKHLLTNIDIRRFINFGVLRGIVYRVYSYPVLNLVTRSIESNDLLQPEQILNNVKRRTKQQHKLKLMQLKGATGYDELLRTRVNEQTLKTETNRRVSFSSVDDRQQQQHEQSRKLSVMNEVIEEDDSSTSDESDNEQLKMKHIPQNRTPRSHRTSSSTASNRVTNDDKNDEDDDEGQSAHQMSEEEEQEIIYLIKMLKGFQHFDSICTELQKSRTDVEKMIEKLGSFSVINC